MKHSVELGHVRYEWILSPSFQVATGPASPWPGSVSSLLEGLSIEDEVVAIPRGSTSPLFIFAR